MNFSWDFASDLGYKVPRLDLAINLQLVEPQGLKLQNRETLTSLFFLIVLKHLQPAPRLEGWEGSSVEET